MRSLFDSILFLLSFVTSFSLVPSLSVAAVVFALRFHATFGPECCHSRQHRRHSVTPYGDASICVINKLIDTHRECLCTVHKYKCNQLNLVKINLKSRILLLCKIPKSYVHSPQNRRATTSVTMMKIIVHTQNGCTASECAIKKKNK